MAGHELFSVVTPNVDEDVLVHLRVMAREVRGLRVAERLEFRESGVIASSVCDSPRIERGWTVPLCYFRCILISSAPGGS